MWSAGKHQGIVSVSYFMIPGLYTSFVIFFVQSLKGPDPVKSDVSSGPFRKFSIFLGLGLG